MLRSLKRLENAIRCGNLCSYCAVEEDPKSSKLKEPCKSCLQTAHDNLARPNFRLTDAVSWKE